MVSSGITINLNLQYIFSFKFSYSTGFSFVLEARSGQVLSAEESYKLGMARDSWCTVEKMKEQDWCRANRRHYPTLHLKSAVLTASTTSEESRCTWSVDRPAHRERRHFANKRAYRPGTRINDVCNKGKYVITLTL